MIIFVNIVFIALEKRLLTPVSHSQARITTRLQQYRTKAELSRNTRPQAWVPREKLPRPLTSSASAIRKLMRKAELMGISTDIFPVDTSDASASIDGRRKHKQPALSAEFVNYYLGEETPLSSKVAELFKSLRYIHTNHKRSTFTSVWSLDHRFFAVSFVPVKIVLILIFVAANYFFPPFIFRAKHADDPDPGQHL